MRMLHTMLRVADLDRSLAFYCDGLGMKLRRKMDFPEGQFTLVFIGYGEGHEIELTYNYGKSDYELGDGFGHIAVGVDDIHATCDELRAKGIAIKREPGAMKHGMAVIAFVEDPDGYAIELIEKR